MQLGILELAKLTGFISLSGLHIDFNLEIIL